MANMGLDIVQVSTILNNILTQAKLSPVSVVDTASFIAVAQTTLQQGYDVILKAVSQSFADRSIVSIRPYERKFKNLERSEQQWGNAVRKLNYIDSPMEDNEGWKLVDGQSIDMYKVRSPKVLQTNFYGQSTFQQAWSNFDYQLDIAFSNPQDFQNWYMGYVQNKADQREQAHESLARTCLTNLIGGVIAGNGTGYVKVLTAYNEQNGTELTVTDIMKSENFPDFLKFFVSLIKTYMKRMSERSQLYQMNITGKAITRHTPASKARMYLYTPFIERAKTEVLTDIFHEKYITLENFEEVNFWQSINPGDEMKINLTAGYLNTEDGSITSKAVTNNYVLGTIFDMEACGYTVTHRGGGATPYNPAGGYSNTFINMADRYYNDFTEKAIVFTLE